MAKLNMAKVKTLIRKGYLLAGVIMAANMFVVNEMRATDKNSNFEANELINPKKKDEGKKTLSLESVLYFVITHENYINLFGGLASSVANNYLKLWDYNPGRYFKLGCFGWRSKSLLNGIFQFEVNLNIGRGISWSIPHIIYFKQFLSMKETQKDKEDENINSNAGYWVNFFIKDILQGFVSTPLTFHISKFNFSISISLDAILWKLVIGKFLVRMMLKKRSEHKIY